jgi:uncharacterized protein (DUF885 family)
MPLIRRDVLLLPALLAPGLPGRPGMQALARSAAARSPMGERLFALLERADRDDMALDPQGAVLRGDTSRAHEFGDDLSDEHSRAVRANLRSQLEGLARIDRARLHGTTERVAYDVFRWQLDLARRRESEGHARFARQMPVDHLFGRHVTFANFSSGSMAPYASVKDYDDGLARWPGFARWVDRAIDRMREGIAARRTLPRHLAHRVLAQLDDALATPHASSPYLEPVRNLPSTFVALDRERLSGAYTAGVEQTLMPAYRRLAAFVRDNYIPKARTGAPGVGALPGGRAYYDHQLETMTTLRMSADAIHRAGLDEVARIRADFDRVRARLGFGGDLQAFFRHLKDDPRYKFEHAQALLDAYRQMAQRVDALVAARFERVPRSRLEVRAVPKELESSVAGASYQVGTPDGERPGVFHVNTSELPTRTSTRVAALYLHEGLPGHHLQGSLAQESDELPPLLRFGWNVGYGEGWALYAEWLGYEMGLYDDPVQHAGALDMEIFRAARLVVDTGLHAKGWSRQRAVDYMVANTSLEPSFVEQEVDRYLAWPGQACGYKLGEATIRRLRRHAQAALGSRFDARRFHSQVLDTGALPLEVLVAKIEAWVRAGGA